MYRKYRELAVSYLDVFDELGGVLIGQHIPQPVAGQNECVILR